MTRVLALVSGFGWHVDDLRRAAPGVGVDLEPVPFGSLTGHSGVTGRGVEAQGRPLSEVDGVLVRMMPPGSLEQVVFRMDTLHRLEREGLPLLNGPRAVEAAVDKYLSLTLIERAGLPVPPTFACETAADALTAYDRLGPDAVIKPLFGSEGRGLLRVSDRELAWRACQTLERLGSVIYLQSAVRHDGSDLRAFVLGGRVIGAIRRHAAPGDWRTNVALGGRPEAVTLETPLESLAVAAADALGAGMAGVDLMVDLDRGGPVVLEVNAVPGWRALARATGVDVAAAVLAHLRDRSRGR